MVADSTQNFNGALIAALTLSFLVKVAFGFMGALALSHDANLFDDLFFSEETPTYLSVSVFLYSIIVVLPVAIKASSTANYMLFISGMVKEPVNWLLGILLPWVCGAVVNHLQLYAYLVNWTALITSIYVQFVCPLFMWSKATKEASLFEANFKSSMQMILSLTTP
jgi:hypothetical protein